jgi:hypothetical protein
LSRGVNVREDKLLTASERGKPRLALSGRSNRRRRNPARAVWRRVQALPQLHLLPDFIIIGAMRCGTTSLHRYLSQHPCVRVPETKELHFFDQQFAKGLSWYRRLFPTYLDRLRAQWRTGHRLVTGESTPYYLFNPHAPSRVCEAVPRAKLIVLLRDPVDRAYSHYVYEVKHGRETLPLFEAALDAEPSRLSGELEKMLSDPAYFSFEHGHHAYQARGIYVDQIMSWRQFFPAAQMLVLTSEELFEDPPAAYGRVLAFLGLPPHTLAAWDVHNASDYSEPLAADLHERLSKYYAPHNQRLYEYLGVDYGW